MSLSEIRYRNQLALIAYAVCQRFHKARANPDILDQCWEYQLNKNIEFLLEKIDELTAKPAV